MLYEIKYNCISHIGNCRTINQDSFICNGSYVIDNTNTIRYDAWGCAYPGNNAVFGVFDGMGGLAHGEIASQIAAQNATKLQLGSDVISELDEYCTETNAQICELATQMHCSSSGTTAALLAFTNNEIALCNIGDSKIFRITYDSIEQISKDHIVNLPGTNRFVLSQNLGISEDQFKIQPYFALGNYSAGDIYLICSDGLTDMLTTDEIHYIVANSEFDNVAERLLDRALDAGGRDNISLIMCRIQHRNILKMLTGGKIYGKSLLEKMAGVGMR